MYNYAILNEDNIAFTIASFQQEFEMPPQNYIKVNDDSMLWHKYENGIWSVEKFEPVAPDSKPTLEEEIKSLKQDNLMLMDAIASMYEEILNLQSTINV